MIASLKKHIHLVLSIFLIVWTLSLLSFIYNTKEGRLKDSVELEMSEIALRYEVIKDMYKIVAENTFRNVVKSKETMEILKKIKNPQIYNLDDVRDELRTHLSDNYEYMKNINFRQFHFHLKDNTSFLRMHSPNRFGDDLSDVRFGITYVNKHLVAVDGFEEGKIINGFRFIFPIIDDESEHLGSVEIALRVEAFVESMRSNEIEDIHLLVLKEVVDKKFFEDERVINYEPSKESQLYYVQNGRYLYRGCDHAELKNELKDEISKNIKTDKKFIVYDKDNLLIFLPIKNIEGKRVAYFVIYKDPEHLIHIVNNFRFITSLILFALFVVLYMIYKNHKMRLLEQGYTQEIQYQNKTLKAIVDISHELIINQNFQDSVNNALKKIVEVLDANRVYIFENHLLNGNLVCSQRFEAVKFGTTSEIENPLLQNLDYGEAGLDRWLEILGSNKSIEGVVKDFPDAEREILESQNIISILVIPIWYDDKFWGFIGFDDCTKERDWRDFERDVLSAFSNSFISALNKQNYSQSLERQVSEQLKEIRDKEQQLLQTTKQAQMGDMIGMIAHQWRQPLNAISASAISMGLKSSMGILGDEDIQENSEFIQAQCQKMSKTIDTFMNFVKPAKEEREFKIIHSIESVMQIMGTQLANHNIDVKIETEDKDISIIGHEDLLEQVIINLLANARDAFDDVDISDKKIIIKIEKVKDGVIVRVEDNAGGIKDEVKDKIFNPYFTTKEQGKGTGLGLYMSMDIIRKSFNGELIHSNTAEGSLFEVNFKGK